MKKQSTTSLTAARPFGRAEGGDEGQNSPPAVDAGAASSPSAEQTRRRLAKLLALGGLRAARAEAQRRIAQREEAHVLAG